MPKNIYMNAELNVSGSISGKTKIINQSAGPILPENCYGDTIYITVTGGTLTLPVGVVGMNLQTINATTHGDVIVKVSSGEFLDNTLNGSDNLKHNGTGKPHIHKFICGAPGKWYILH